MQTTLTKTAMRSVNIFDVPGAGVVRVLPKPTAQFKAIQKAREAMFGPSIMPVGKSTEELTAFSPIKAASQQKLAMPLKPQMFSPLMRAARFGRAGAYKAPVGFNTVSGPVRSAKGITGTITNLTRAFSRRTSPMLTRAISGGMAGGYAGAGVDAAVEYPGFESNGLGMLAGTLIGAANPWLARAARRAGTSAAVRGNKNHPMHTLRRLTARGDNRKHLDKWVAPPLKRLADLSMLGAVQEAITGGEANFMRVAQTADATKQLYTQRLEDIYNGNMR